jgi:hypothetical protein
VAKKASQLPLYLFIILLSKCVRWLGGLAAGEKTRVADPQSASIRII